MAPVWFRANESRALRPWNVNTCCPQIEGMRADFVEQPDRAFAFTPQMILLVQYETG
jgi:hypothetical protein